MTPGIVAANIEAMAPYDWVALLFATFVVALAVVGELKAANSSRWLCSTGAAPRWRLALALLSGVRRWVFLPTLVMTVPMMVAMKSGDALSVCFNTIASFSSVTLIIYLQGLAERAYGLEWRKTQGLSWVTRKPQPWRATGWPTRR